MDPKIRRKKKTCVRNTINAKFVEIQIVDDTYRSDIWNLSMQKVLKWQKKRAPKSRVAVVVFQSLSW